MKSNLTELKTGSVVLSKAGRDKGGYFVVCDVAENAVYIVDGETHRLCKPKIKNIKHVAATGRVIENIAAKFATGKKVFDSEVRSALRPFNDKDATGDLSDGK